MQEYVTEKFMKQLEKAVRDCPHPDTEEEILYMGKAYVTFFIENPQYYKFLYFHEFMTVDLSLYSTGNFPPFEFLRETVIRLNHINEKKLSEYEQELELLKLWSDVQGLASIESMRGVKWNEEWEDTIVKILCYNNRG